MFEYVRISGHFGWGKKYYLGHKSRRVNKFTWVLFLTATSTGFRLSSPGSEQRSQSSGTKWSFSAAARTTTSSGTAGPSRIGGATPSSPTCARTVTLMRSSTRACPFCFYLLSAVLLIPRFDPPKQTHVSLSIFHVSPCFFEKRFKIEKKYVSVFSRVLECWVQTNSALIYAGAVKDLRSIS